MQGFDPTAPGAFALVALVAMRVGGLLLVAPMFGSRVVPAPVRAALLLLLTLLMLPAASVAAEARPQLTPATILTETLVGFGIGLGAAVFLGAAELAGDVLGVQTGLASASALDPLTQVQTGTVGQFMQLFTLVVLLSVGAHLLMLRALAGSLELLPPGAPLAAAAGAASLVRLGGSLFAVGLQLAAPVTAAVLVANLALGVVGRAAPQLNILMVAFPVQIGVGLLAMAAAVPLIGVALRGWPGIYEGLMSGFFEALGAGVR